MSAFELQSAISDTFLEMVLEQRVRAKQQRENILQQEMIQQEVARQATASSLKVYAKAA
jgi:hypothetical protein